MKALLIRPSRNENEATWLSRLGFQCVIDPYLTIQQFPNPMGAHRMFEALEDQRPKWFVNTSTNAFENFENQLPPQAFDRLDLRTIRFAAIGEATKNQLLAMGAPEVLVSSDFSAASLADQMLRTAPVRAVIPGGNLAMRAIPDAFTKAGLEVVSEVVYHTSITKPEPESAFQLRAGEFDLVVLRSPSAVRALFSYVPKPKTRFLCLGKATAAALQAQGYRPDFLTESGDQGEVETQLRAFAMERK